MPQCRFQPGDIIRYMDHALYIRGVVWDLRGVYYDVRTVVGGELSQVLVSAVDPSYELWSPTQ